MSLSPEQVVMEREDEHEKRCCGAGRFVLLRDPSPEELSIAQETCAPTPPSHTSPMSHVLPLLICRIKMHSFLFIAQLG